MNRRTFLQAMSAAFGTACIGTSLIERRPLPIRYDLFCDPEAHRYNLAKPFSVGESVCATDAKTLIVHGDTNGLTKGIEGRFPNIGKLDWTVFDKGGWKKLGNPQFYNAAPEFDVECPECLATGRVGRDVRRCVVCGGNSDNWEMLSDGTNGCPKCHYGWIGGDACHRCKPERDVDGDVSVGLCKGRRVWELIDGEPFAAARVNMVRTLGDVEYLVDPLWCNGGETGPILAFRFNAGAAGEGRGLAVGLDLSRCAK